MTGTGFLLSCLILFLLFSIRKTVSGQKKSAIDVKINGENSTEINLSLAFKSLLFEANLLHAAYRCVLR